MEKRPLFWLLYSIALALVLTTVWGSVALVIWVCERYDFPQNGPIWLTATAMLCGYIWLSCWLVRRWPR
jgi:hypothetical protein